MDFSDIFPRGLGIDDALDLLRPVAVYILGMSVYAFFVFRFYRFVASRDMFALDLSKYEESQRGWLRVVLHLVLYVCKYIILFPVFAFFWFGVLTVILAFLSRDQTMSEILRMALVTVSSIRVVSYYDEDLSRDLAKILPFGVLAFFLVDSSSLSVRESFDVLRDVRDHSENILYYLVLLIALEFTLRLLMAFVKFLFGGKPRRAEDEEVAEPEPPQTPTETPRRVRTAPEPGPSSTEGASGAGQ